MQIVISEFYSRIYIFMQTEMLLFGWSQIAWICLFFTNSSFYCWKSFFITIDYTAMENVYDSRFMWPLSWLFKKKKILHVHIWLDLFRGRSYCISKKYLKWCHTFQSCDFQLRSAATHSVVFRKQKIITETTLETQYCLKLVFELFRKQHAFAKFNQFIEFVRSSDIRTLLATSNLNFFCGTIETKSIFSLSTTNWHHAPDKTCKRVMVW